MPNGDGTVTALMSNVRQHLETGDYQRIMNPNQRSITPVYDPTSAQGLSVAMRPDFSLWLVEGNGRTQVFPDQDWTIRVFASEGPTDEVVSFKRINMDRDNPTPAQEFHADYYGNVDEARETHNLLSRHGMGLQGTPHVGWPGGARLVPVRVVYQNGMQTKHCEAVKRAIQVLAEAFGGQQWGDVHIGSLIYAMRHMDAAETIHQIKARGLTAEAWTDIDQDRRRVAEKATDTSNGDQFMANTLSLQLFGTILYKRAPGENTYLEATKRTAKRSKAA
ncbi:MAG: hypothetical protein DRQ55_19550 [Planctomycetota bacterium]|nr:MAG: hypothetical protein DRQ55_19550 [Planctomycetota bacterium]